MARSRASSKIAHEDRFIEPNLTPIMDINFMLISGLLMLASMAPIGFASIQAPQISDVPTNTAGATKPNEMLLLTVFIMRDGFNIAASGKTLNGDSEGRAGQPLLPKITDKNGKSAYDFAALRNRLIEIKKTFPKEKSLFIAADEDVIYDDVIQTMDAARATEDRQELFPAVALSPGLFQSK